MAINKFPGSEENAIFQKSIYYTFFYGTISFVLVLVSLLLLYVTCSKKYRLNWFEKNLLERANSTCSEDECISVATECESKTSKSVYNVTNESKFWVPLNKAKSSLSVNEKEDSCLGDITADHSGSRSSIVSFNGENSGEKEAKPIASSDSQVVLCTTKPARPRVSSMNTKLDHTKIDSSYYQEEGPKSPTVEDTIGSVNVSMSYDQAAGILSVRLIQVKELKPRDFSGTSDPYAKIRLLPDLKNVWQTRIHKKTVNPVFDEDFVFEVSPASLSHRSLEIILYDFDAYSRHLSLGEVKLPLADFDLSEKVVVWKNLEPCPEPHKEAELGDLMVTMSYLQTAERLTIIVNKARNLRVVDDTRVSSDPFVKVSLIQDGKRLKKKKTSVQKNSTNPVFKENITFDVSKENLSKICVEFSVYHDNKLGPDEFLGRAMVGLASSCQPEEVKFFKEIFTSKSAVSKWLTLRDYQYI